MGRPQSRTRRQAAFLGEAKRMYEQLEDWYDEHPGASFGELEAEARKRRRELMGKVLGQLVNGRDTGAQVEQPKCKQCGKEMEFTDTVNWDVVHKGGKIWIVENWEWRGSRRCARSGRRS